MTKRKTGARDNTKGQKVSYSVFVRVDPTTGTIATGDTLRLRDRQ